MTESKPDDLTTLLETAKRKTVLGNQIDLLRIRFEAETMFSYQNGTFQITDQFLAMVWMKISILAGTGQSGGILIDHYGYPVAIDDFQKFLDLIEPRYTSAIRRYYTGMEQIRNKSMIEVITDGESA